MQHTAHQTQTTALFSARELLRGDIFAETFARSLRTQPLAAFKAIKEITFKGSTLEHAVATFLPFDASAMLYDPKMMQKVSDARKSGLDVALIHDLPEDWVNAIASHIGIDKTSGPNVSAESLNVSMGLMPGTHIWRPSTGGLQLISSILSAMRVYQWPKNALVFLPIFLSHRFHELNLVLASVLAFMAISLMASFIYILNDLLDISTDRRHPSKCRRPFASGALSFRHGLCLSFICASAAFALTLSLPPMFSITLMLYMGLNVLYTVYLKRRLLVDVLALASSYTLRILAGNAATGIELSFWLLAFSIFLFFSLALVKRYVEMDRIGVSQPDEKRVMGRGYRYVDLDMLSQMGVASAFSAVLVLALYVERAGTTGLYSNPELIWLICPIVMYVISRIWFLAKRGEMKDDPVAFVIRDWRSHVMGAVAVVIMIAASW